MTQVSESDYRTAQEARNHKIKQEFLNTVDLGDAREAVRSITYVYNPYQILAGDANHTNACRMTCTYPHVSENILKIYGLSSTEVVKRLLRSDLKVYPAAFKQPFNVFISELLHHECYHAGQYYAKPREVEEIISLEGKEIAYKFVLDSILEIPALIHQLAHSSDIKLPSDEIKKIMEDLRIETRSLEACQVIYPQTKKLLEDSLRDFEMETEVRDWLRREMK